jgi:hypothetical protein
MMQNQTATTDVKCDTEAGPSTGRRLPPWQAPQNKTAAMANEVGPSNSVITGTPLVVTRNEDLLVLPLIPRDIFKELTTLFNDCDSPLKGPDTSDEESKHCKMGWPEE